MVAATSDTGPVTDRPIAPTPGPTDPSTRYGANMTEPDAPAAGPVPVAPRREAAAHDEILERIDDLTRVVARQAATIERLADDAKARAQRERQGADLPLVTELFALLGDTVACASTAESAREREAFDAVAGRIERLLVGRGGTVVAPCTGAAFDSLTMEAADVVRTDNPDEDRTVDSLVQPGLSIPGRSIRPARVVVRQHRKPKE